ncbi:30S ribosomal protein S13, chloroplastic [Arachis duranensis]|uniref:30S ribosomal protein S13, chloroplastic n=1 Tax=Arachis duranensis TaxID=130453 RepID=A0A9C6TFN1_ARADU|nr:30S ribosomal protein S13, chloroplastic [Arachis duranensis]
MPLAPSLALISNPRPLSRAVYFPVLNPPKVRGLSIECARVGGVEIPNNKRIEFSLQYIHGIGRSRARKILCDISMDNKVTKDLSEEELITLRDKVSKYVIEGDLGWIISLSLQAEMGEEVKAIVPVSVLKKQKREEEWALKKKEELDAAKKKRAESRKLIYSRAKQYAKEYQEQKKELIIEETMMHCIAIDLSLQ